MLPNWDSQTDPPILVIQDSNHPLFEGEKCAKNMSKEPQPFPVPPSTLTYASQRWPLQIAISEPRQER